MSVSSPEQQQFFCIGGTLSIDAQSYVERAADRELLAALRAGEFCYVLTSRQMGKSSLMVRTACQLREEGAHVVILDLTAVGTNLTPEQWYFTLLCQLGERLGCEDEVEALWDSNAELAPLARWMLALREIVLHGHEHPVVIFVDEIDYVRSLPFPADEFFAAIRECYNGRTRDESLRRLSFCLLGVAMPADLIRDPRMTPFNIGRAVNLADFTPAEAEPLSVGLHRDSEVARTLIGRVTYWTGGQPYLTQKLCAEVRRLEANAPAGVDAVCEKVFLSPHAREHDDNLHLVQDRVLRSSLDQAALLDTYAQVCRGARVADDDLDPVVNELRLAGIVHIVGGYLRVRNEIYRRVFDLRWVREKMPDAELRRQRAAFYRGVRRVAVAAAVVTLLVGALAVFGWQQKSSAMKSAGDAKLQEEKANEQKEIADRNAAQAKVNADSANAQKHVAELRQKEITANFVRTQEGLIELLQSLGPLLASKSKSREKVLETAKRLHDGVSRDVLELPEVQLNQADLLREYSRLYRKIGNSEQALKSAEEARRIVADWVTARPDDLQLKLRLVECEDTIGNAILGERDPLAAESKNEEDLPKAIAAFQRGVALAQELLKANPRHPLCVEAVFSALGNLGNVQAKLKQFELALQSYREAGELIRSLLKDDPENAEHSERLAHSEDQIGDVHFRRRTGDDVQQARKHFTSSLSIRKKLLESSDAEGKSVRQINLATSYNKLGKAFAGEERTPQALEYYQKAAELRQQIVKDDPKNLEVKRNLAYTYYNLGAVYHPRWNYSGNPKMTVEYFDKRFEIARDLFKEEDPSNADWKVDYCEALYALADSLMLSDATRGRLPEAEKLAREAVELTEESNPRFLIAFAQALRLNGNFVASEVKLNQAEKLLPDSASTGTLKTEIAALRKQLQKVKGKTGGRR